VDYLVLFATAFGAATLIPMSSELVLISMLSDSSHYFLLWFCATTANTLGSVVNWVLGRYLMHYQDRRWFPFKPKQLQRSRLWFERYGKWSLLFSWLPIVGDGITFIAGLMKTHIVPFTALVLIAKGGRYAFIMWVYLSAARL